MAKQVIWSPRALQDRKQILTHWTERNKSKAYSVKLDQLFRQAIHLIKEYPRIGKPTQDPGVRIKIVRDYLIFYEETSDSIVVLTIWDSRRDPSGLEGKIS